MNRPRTECWLLSLAVLLPAGCADEAEPEVLEKPLELRVMTFNTGTPNLPGEAGNTVDDHYGNGLSTPAIIEDTRKFITTVEPDILGF